MPQMEKKSVQRDVVRAGAPLEPRQGAPKPRPDLRPRRGFSSDGFPDNSGGDRKTPGQPKARAEICEDFPTVRVAPNMER
ncbi:hypothetical protein CEXT_306891 [Caerostris extrusa]|uniref:Uncharacterized protein n=1 Tax=Caerostris extrusa TaxID=172846 RepID=A0AAV4XSM8_CAEEX|nr:hypothetical protein CEXT_306891 [Caerostris extrusa]